MTPEQIAQWVREAGFVLQHDEYEFKEMLRLFAIRAYTEGRAKQAETDARLSDDGTIDGELLAQRIRANAPRTKP